MIFKSDLLKNLMNKAELIKKIMQKKEFSQLSKKDVELLKAIGDDKLIKPNCAYEEANHFYDLANSKTIEEFRDQLTYSDIINIKMANLRSEHDRKIA